MVEEIFLGTQDILCKVARVIMLSMCSVMSYSLRPYGLYPPGSSVHWIFQAGILESFTISYSRGLPDLGIELASPESSGLVDRCFTTESPGKQLYSNKNVKRKILVYQNSLDGNLSLRSNSASLLLPGPRFWLPLISSL